MASQSIGRPWRDLLSQSQRDQVELSPCRHAQQFERLLEGLIFSQLGSPPTLQQLVQAKHLLQEKAWEFRSSLPPDHDPNSLLEPHRCVLASYDEAFARLHDQQRQLYPPVNIIGDYEELTKKPPEPAPKKPRSPAPGRVLFERKD